MHTSEIAIKLQRFLSKLAEIKKELIAQYNLYYDLMGAPDYWNTHQNTHVDFGIYRLFVDTAAELGINKMRSHQRIYVKPSSNSQKLSLRWRILEPVKAQLLNIWQNNAHKKGILSPDGLIVCLSNSDINNLEYIFANISWQNKNIGEYVIHPAAENDSPYFGGIVEQRIREYEIFTSNKTKEIIEKADIKLTSY